MLVLYNKLSRLWSMRGDYLSAKRRELLYDYEMSYIKAEDMTKFKAFRSRISLKHYTYIMERQNEK